MTHTFNEITRNIVDHFLQNILFIDDNAYPTKDHQKVNVFDASEISSVFAQKGKLCTIFAPNYEKDLQTCSSLSAKSDVVVLDWYLDLRNEQSIENEEDDADSEEPRGIYTTRLINNIIEDAREKKLKLIIVYTGETDLHGITEELYKGIVIKGNFDKGDCRISSSNVSILICAKYKDDNQFKHNPELKNKIVKYEDLPEFITDEFSNFVGGLLPDFAMSAIVAIRNNTSNILGVFSKDIDPAFLGHYVSIPDSNDAISMLSEIFGSAMTDLIDSSNFDFKTWIDKWLTQKFRNQYQTKIGNNQISVTRTNIQNIVNSTEEEFRAKLRNEGFRIKGNEDELKKDAIKLFKTSHKKPNYKLAKLIQHSNPLSPSQKTRLTTGTIIKYKKANRWRFLLCIQQRCDSVRIGIGKDKKEKSRSFLFLPLQQKGKGEAVVVEENKHLFVDSKSYSIELHKFKPIGTDAQIFAKPQNDQYVFTDMENKQYFWVAELKDMFAQHIVSDYASQLSRVGIDNSEWIRIVGKIGK